MTDTVLSYPAPDEPTREVDALTGDVVYVESTDTRAPFIVDNDRKATWAMRRLSELTAQVASVESIVAAEHERIRRWAEEETRRHAADMAYFEAQLIRYGRQRRIDTDGKVKSVSTPYGKVTSTSTQAKYVIDPEVFLAWAMAERPDWVRTKHEPALDAVKAATTVEDTETLGLVAMTEHGEIIPGVTIEPAGVNYKVKVDS
jgi:hypothetical protein